MPTQLYKDSLKAMAADNPAFADTMLEGAVTALFAGHVDEGRILLRTYVNSTMGFEELSRLTGKNAKSLMRMLGPSGNPTANNLFEIIAQLGRAEGVTIEAHVVRAPATA